ncbi:hypothetical protein IXEL_34 [Microbacterium phage Ixel]|nr:hypothetical protein IXEL_34 [Microbacterium phage Ixel]
MAKKIRLDFSKVEERSGWKTDHMPEGLHEFKIELVDDRDANDGTEMYTYGLRPTDPRYKTRLFPYYCKQQPNQYFKIRDLHIAAGVMDPKKAKGKAVDIIVDAPVGKIIAAEVVDSRNPQYVGRSEIDGVYDRSIIEEDDRVADDEDDEEYEGDEEAEDEEYEDEDSEDEGDDERAEELEGLGLPALRKEAKGLGIDTAGLKKAELIEAILEAEEEADEDDEDEDDLDDEDLDDEELEDEEEFEDDEDEEEEEAPAPRKRPAAKKPAAKAPAKSAPARRTIKRR